MMRKPAIFTSDLPTNALAPAAAMLALAAALLFLPAVSSAETTEPQSGPEKRMPLGIGIPDSSSSVTPRLDISAGGSLLFMLALLLGGYGVWYSRRTRRCGPSADTDLQLCSKLMLTPRTSLMLVRVGGKPVLCAVGPENVSLMNAEIGTTMPFHDLLLSDDGISQPETSGLASASPPANAVGGKLA